MEFQWTVYQLNKLLTSSNWVWTHWKHWKCEDVNIFISRRAKCLQHNGTNYSSKENEYAVSQSVGTEWESTKNIEKGKMVKLAYCYLENGNKAITHPI
jgi:hypothetical protein